MSDFYSASAAEQAEKLGALASRALSMWELAGASLTLVKFRENAVFKALAPSGKAYALRIHRAGYHDDAELRSELQWMQALLADGFDVPLIVPSVSGRLFEVVESKEIPEPRQIDVFEWLSGRQLGTVETGVAGDAASLERTFRTVGSLAARLHNQASAWTPPPGFTRHAWDAAGLLGEQPFWGRFWELAALSREQRGLLEEMRRAARSDLAALPQDRDRYGLIHADFCPENLLVDGSRIRLLDFDDAGFGWHLFEIATSLYFHSAEPHFPQLERAMLAGYRSVRPLPESESARLPLFYALRASTYLGWVHTRHETETAREMIPTLVQLACAASERYLEGR
jgi:Ser/Thr protein kinase RdoA (MazF antagonist)